MIATTGRLRQLQDTVTILTVAALTGGCGGSHAHPSSLEATELLDLLQVDSKRHDPEGFVEFDIGEFRVTRSLGAEGGTFSVRFHLYGVLPEKNLVEFQEKSSRYEKRLRDAVLSIVQSCDQSELITPRLGVVKSQLTRSINEMLRTRSLRDVVFSELIVDRD